MGGSAPQNNDEPQEPAKPPEGGEHTTPPGVSDGTRTRDFLDHNQVLYQLSYTHHALSLRATLA